MIRNEDIDRLASHLADQRLRGVDVAFPDGEIITDRRDIYRIQERVTRLLGGGVPPSAYKLAWLPQALVNSPAEQFCCSGVPAGRLFSDGAVMTNTTGQRLGFECEIACRLGMDSQGHVSPTATLLGIEVVEEHGKISRDTIGAIIATGIFNTAYVVGPEIPRWRDLMAAKATVWRNGEVLTSSLVGAAFDPDQQLRAFLIKAKELGWTLPDGAIVSTGTLLPAQWCDPGDEMACEVEGLGRVTASIGAL